MFTLALVWLFLMRIRFPRNQSLAAILNRRYGPRTTANFRKLERTTKQQRKASLDLDFLIRCKSFDIVPKFMKFKLYRKCLYNSEFYKECLEKLMEREISFKKRRAEVLKGQVDSLRCALRDSVSFIDFHVLINTVNGNVTKYCNTIREVHKRKLLNLGGRYDLTSCDPSKVVFNLSTYVLSEREKFLLSFGLDFCLPITKLKFPKYFLSFESLVNRLKLHNILPGKDFAFMVRSVQSIAYKFFYNFKPILCPIFSKDDIILLRNLGKNKDIIVAKPDKGNGVVILNREDYVTKMSDILDDVTKFKKLPYTDPYHRSILSEDKVNRVLSYLKKEKFINDEEYNKCYASGCSPGILYGLPKVHKPNIPLRPVVASYNTPSYNLAKFLVPFLVSITDCTYSLKNSYEFVNILNNFNFPQEYFICSFDVTSLFTNIPLKETIDIAVSEMYKDGNSFRNLTKNKFKSLLETACSDTYFIFNNELYLQLDGVAMGSPISCTLANLFLGYYEKKWLDDCPLEFKPKLYKRYVDDTVLIFDNQQQASNFLNYLNDKHDNIKFTLDQESDNKMPFLDTIFDKTSTSFSIYRKPTFSGLGTSFLSHCPKVFKLNAVKTLLFRAYSICSNFNLLHEEIEFLMKFFTTNGYPCNVVYKCIRLFLENVYNPKVPNVTVPKLNFYCKLPYISNHEKLDRELRCCLDRFYPQLNFKFVFNNNFKLNSLLPFKDKLPESLRSGIIYCYNCPNCQVGYLGSSKKALKTRYCQHAGISDRTGRDLLVKQQSSIRDHNEECNQARVNFENFKVLDTCSNEQDLRILESIYIHKLKPCLNQDQSSFPLSIIS